MNQSDEKKDNIQRVIETALDMFMENGIAATSMNQIARKVNLSQMSLYRYFGNKEELILRIWKYALTEFYRYFYERYTGDENASTGYERFVGLGFFAVGLIKKLVTGELGDWWMVNVFGVFCFASAAMRMVRLRNELTAMREEAEMEAEEKAAKKAAVLDQRCGFGSGHTCICHNIIVVNLLLV